MTVRILQGDALSMLATLPAESVQVCVTSPPYLGLRTYGTDPQTWGGDPSHHHEWNTVPSPGSRTSDTNPGPLQHAGNKGRERLISNLCACGAWRGELGLEPTPALFIEHLVAIFEEVRRVLRADGTCWVNLGDSYWTRSAMRKGGNREQIKAMAGEIEMDSWAEHAAEGRTRYSSGHPTLKDKDLSLIPERFAIAMQDAGWYVRQQIVWAKKSAMPESVRDRCTSSWEPIWLLTKSPRYFFDQTALAEAVATYDTDAVSQVQYRHGNQVVPGLFPGTSDGSILSEEERSASNRMQEVRACPRHSLETNGQRQSISLRDQPEVQREQRRKIQAGGVPSNRSSQGITAEVQPNRQGQGSGNSEESIRGCEGAQETVLRLGQGQGDHRPLSADPEGPGVVAPGSSQAASAQNGATSRSEHANGGRVGLDQSDLRPCLCVLRTDGQALDQRSRHPTVEGRPSRQGEHSPGLPALQQPPQQPRSSAPNARNFWLLGPEPSRLAHYAAYPTELVKRCILAGTSQKGACPACGAPWSRTVERESTPKDRPTGKGWLNDIADQENWASATPTHSGLANGSYQRSQTTGWAPSCTCDAGEPVPCIVMDPFAGSFTTSLTAERLGRDSIGIELSEKYVELGRKRLYGDCPMFSDIEVAG